MKLTANSKIILIAVAASFATAAATVGTLRYFEPYAVVHAQNIARVLEPEPSGEHSLPEKPENPQAEGPEGQGQERGG